MNKNIRLVEYTSA